ncbi:MAG: four helix bundle protein [Opitutaceae bacterium]
MEIYRLTKPFPKDEIYGLTSQVRRSASSIPANIPDGCGRNGDPELKLFMNNSRGSACELDYFILLASELSDIETKGIFESGGGNPRNPPYARQFYSEA